MKIFNMCERISADALSRTAPLPQSAVTARNSPSPVPPVPSGSEHSEHVQYSSCFVLNVQSLNPSASSSSRWKVPEISELIKEENLKHHSIPFIALTETWLKSYISDAQLHISGYVVSRSDRDARVGGGVLLYSHANIPVSECSTFDDGTCEGIFCKFSTIKTCVAVVYRPPNAPLSSFNALLSFLSSCCIVS